MTNPALTWISDAYTGGYLRAAFVDCQEIEFQGPDNESAFHCANQLALDLRHRNVSISHFMLNNKRDANLTPFQYKNKKGKIPQPNMDFKIAIPTSDEWVYPKASWNGFRSPHSDAILSTEDLLGRSTLICAGFTARLCLTATALGSFKKASNPNAHKVIITLNATNLHPDYFHEYATDLLAKADKSIRDKIGFATVEKISATIPTPSLSSPTHPYMVLTPRG